MKNVAAPEINWQVNAKTDSWPIIRVGVWATGVVFLVFLVWATVFPLASAVITPGTLTSEGKNKLVQHPRGGRVLTLNVKEGDFVEAGQVILKLDPTQAKANLSKIDARYASLAALKARLDAERKGGVGGLHFGTPALKNFKLRGTSEFSVSTSLRGTSSVVGARSDNKLPVFTSAAMPVKHQESELILSQRQAYRSGRALLEKEVSALKKKAETLRRQKASVEARIQSQRQLQVLTQNELERIKPLASRGYVARNRLGEARRTLLELQGSIASLTLDASSFENQIAEIEVEIDKAKIAVSDSAAKEYARIVSELAELTDQRVAAKADVDNLVVRAPVSGKLTGLVVNTEGGVFGGGYVVAEIVPAGADLLVEARVSPADIDYVALGQEAEVIITAFDRRLDEPFLATVQYISADAETDRETTEQYFIVRLSLTADDQPGNRISDLQAGMQGEVYIKSGERTFMTYASKPLLDSFKRAFKER